MVNVNKLLGSILSSGAATGFIGGLAGGMASNMVKGKTVKKIGANALKVGGVAAVGALAYTAYKRYSDNQTSATPQHQDVNPNELSLPPEGSAFLPSKNDTVATDELGLVLVRAMIAAARSDGRLDAQESQAIFQRIETLGLDSESQNLLVQEMGHPVDMDSIVNSASSPEVAAEIYIASLLAIDIDTTAEKAYLAMLAARLQLPPPLVLELEQQVSAHKQVA
ncbi:tellurite resistance TerB family protein [Shewanella aestuarii]|uniref:Tellurite resistance TerB family protein n=1 Tax=Shewanella aestuarii TaxID=1028752 RepID=A0A6G9QNH5_9GAMM|nr:tellurite resistance TerB family protein [Shewanella aestuarii]QIR15633.1 tellurite resistance TerB family protein [Shewanella aestuarii]